MNNNCQGLHIRAAIAEDAVPLTRISFASKSYWNYPEVYYKAWSAELTITPDYIANSHVFVAMHEAAAIGYCAVVHRRQQQPAHGIILEKGFWLEHMFVVPEHIGCGVGTRLVQHLKGYCLDRRIRRLAVLADPHALGFYEKCGFSYQREVASTIAGRSTPLLILQTQRCSGSEKSPV